MSITNRRLINKEGADFYPTPSWGTEALLSGETFVGSILEPCCGDGAISKVLESAGYKVESSDFNSHGYGKTGIDALFLKGPYENVVTNPPYNIATPIIEHFLDITERKVAMFLRIQFLESRGRYKLFTTPGLARVHIFSERISLKKKMDTCGGGTTAYAWFVWENGYKGHPELRWIEPRTKKSSIVQTLTLGI